MDIKKNKKLSRIISILGSIAQLVLVVFLVVLAALSFATRLPFFARLGLNFFAVTSGSMEPKIPVGSLVYAGKYKLEDLKKEDVITFKVRDDQNGQVSVVTHRIAEVMKDEKTEKIKDDQGKETEKKIVKYEFVTKGDANNTVDARTVPAANIIGLYQWQVPYVGYVTNFTQTGKGFILLVIIPAVILIVWELVSLITHIKNYYQEKAKKEIEKIKKQLEAESKEVKKRKKSKK